MKIFISWSGKRSQIIAERLDTWLPKVIQSVETFYSPQIEKGTRGGAEINASLEGTSFGIICLTPDNLDSTWIHYEAGALAKISDSNTRVWTLLNGLNHSDVKQPLAQFQHTLTQKEDIYNLLKSINTHLEKPLLEHSLRDTFEKWWTDLEEIIKKAENIASEKQDIENIRPDREILNEMLELMRNQQRQLNELRANQEINANKISGTKQIKKAFSSGIRYGTEIELTISKAIGEGDTKAHSEIFDFLSNVLFGMAEFEINDKGREFYIYILSKEEFTADLISNLQNSIDKMFRNRLKSWQDSRVRIKD